MNRQTGEPALLAVERVSRGKWPYRTIRVKGDTECREYPPPLSPGARYAIAYHDEYESSRWPGVSIFLVQSYPGDCCPETQPYRTPMEKLGPLLDPLPETDADPAPRPGLHFVLVGVLLVLVGTRGLRRHRKGLDQL
jgi:hypothetical protein